MKKLVITILMLVPSVCSAFVDSYEVSRSTFNCGSMVVSSGTPVLVNPPLSNMGYSYYSISIWNISSSSIAYTLSTSSTSSGLACSNGGLIGTGSETAPYILTEQFDGLYMWLVACGNSAISDVRRLIRGR